MYPCCFAGVMRHPTRAPMVGLFPESSEQRISKWFPGQILPLASVTSALLVVTRSFITGTSGGV